MKKIFLIFSLILYSSFGFSSEKPYESKIQKFLDKHVENNQTVGQVVGIIDGDYSNILFSGYLDLETKKPLDGSELFSIGSVSKTFTSHLLSIAKTKNLLPETGLETKVKNYLPELDGFAAGEITLKSLSIHTSGLERSPVITDSKKPYENYSKESLIKQLKEIKTLSPGSYAYSNFGFALLGLCLEKIFNLDFDETVYSEIARPLGMVDFTVIADDSYLDRIPAKYNQAFEPLPLWKDLGAMNPAGSFKANADEMLKYARAFMDQENSPFGESVKLSTQEILTKEDGSKRSLAWELIPIKDELCLFHNGYTLGFITNLIICQKSRKAILQMSASDTYTPCIAETFFGAKNCEIDSKKPFPLEAQEEYGGTFVNIDESLPEPLWNIYIRTSEYGFLVWDRSTPLRLYEKSKDLFEFSDNNLKNLSVKFNRDETGSIISLELLMDGKSQLVADKKTN